MRLSLLSSIILLCISGLAFADGEDCLSAFPLIEQDENNLTRDNIFYNITWLPDSNCMLLASSSGLQIIDALNITEHGFLANGDIKNIAIDSTGTQIAYSLYEAIDLHILDSNGTSTVLSLNRIITDFIFLADNNNLAVATTRISPDEDAPFHIEAQIHILNFQTSQEISVFESSAGAIITLESISDNRLLSVGYNNGFPQAVVQTWDLNNTEPLWDYFDIASELLPSDLFEPFMIKNATTQNSVIAGSGVMGYYNLDNYYGYGIQLWDALSLESISEIAVFNSNELRSGLHITDIALSFDAEIVIATSSIDIFAWNVTTGNLISQSTITSGSIQEISSSPDNSLIAINISIDEGEIIEILDFNTLEPIGLVNS